MTSVPVVLPVPQVRARATCSAPCPSAPNSAAGPGGMRKRGDRRPPRQVGVPEVSLAALWAKEPGGTLVNLVSSKETQMASSEAKSTKVTAEPSPFRFWCQQVLSGRLWAQESSFIMIHLSANNYSPSRHLI